jgi:hypothetical protein
LKIKSITLTKGGVSLPNSNKKTIQFREIKPIEPISRRPRFNGEIHEKSIKLSKSKFDCLFFIAVINQLLDIKAKDKEKKGGGLEEGEDYRLLE